MGLGDLNIKFSPNACEKEIKKLWGELISLRNAIRCEETVTTAKDELVKVSLNDTVADFLATKLIAGFGISLLENDNGSNETLSVINTLPDQVITLTEGSNVTITGTYPNFTISASPGTGEANTASNIGAGEQIFAQKVGVDLQFKSLIEGVGISLLSDSNEIFIVNSSPDQIVTLTEGSNVTITGTYPNFTIAAAGGGLDTDELVKISSNDTTAGYLNGKLVAGTGIILTENNNGGNETLSVINSAPDQTVVLTEGAAIDISGTYPNFTITHQDTSSVSNLDTSGAQVIDILTFDTFGHVQSVTTRNLTLADLGYSVPNAERFGLTGEDDVATENRLFTLSGSFDIELRGSDASNYLKFSPTSNNKFETLSTNGTFYSLVSNDSSGGFYVQADRTDVGGSGGLIAALYDQSYLELATPDGTTGLLNNYTGVFAYSLLAIDNPYMGYYNDKTQGVRIGKGPSLNSLNLEGIQVFPTKEIRFHNYPSTRDDGDTAKALFISNSSGDVKYGDIVLTSTSISDFNEAVDDRVDALIIDGTGISTSYNDGANTLTITNTAPDQTVTLTEGAGIDVTGTYPNFTIASTITQYTDEMAQDAAAAAIVTNGTHDGVSAAYDDVGNGIDLTNTDKGSSQNIFKNVAVSGQNTVVADSNNDTLTLVAGTNITITTDDTTDSITINSSGGGGGSGTVNTGAQYKAAYYPSAGTTVDDWIGVNFGQTNLNTEIVAQATGETILKLTKIASHTGDIIQSVYSNGNLAFQIQDDAKALFTSDTTGVTLQNSLGFDYVMQLHGGNNALFKLTSSSGFANNLTLSTGSGLQAYYGGLDGSFIGTGTNKPLNLIANDSTKVVINTSGEVLINSATDNGDFKLQVTGGTYLDVTSKELRFVGVGTDNTITQLYGIDGSGNVKLRDVSSISGGGGYVVHTIDDTDSPYTVSETSGEVIILIDATAGDVTVNIPTAVGNTAKYSFKRINSAANDVVIDADGTEEIDGDTTQTILFENTSFTIISDNASWWRIN